VRVDVVSPTWGEGTGEDGGGGSSNRVCAF